MNINRHNYEEFFLLYVDNELSAADKKAVDVFVQENPDLQGELLLLQETVAKADDVVLEKKDWLFMEEGVSALQENLLLYADGELSPSEIKTVEALLATDRSAKAELNILQQTKLQPDTSVVFADKQSLYRTEGGRVVGFKWWRVAAAAVLLGLVVWTGVTVYNNNTKTIPVTEGVVKRDNTNPEKIQNEIPVNTNTPGTNQAETTTPQNTTAAVQKNAVQPLTQNNKQPVQKTVKQNTIEQKDNVAVQEKNQKPGNNLPRPYFENINRAASNEVVRNNVIPENDNGINGSGINNAIIKINPNEKIANPVLADINKSDTDPIATAIPAVNKTGGENNNRYLDIDESKGKRTMLGGLIRKAKRMVERTTNIKTGDGLKVAGFEIALK